MRPQGPSDLVSPLSTAVERSESIPMLRCGVYPKDWWKVTLVRFDPHRQARNIPRIGALIEIPLLSSMQAHVTTRNCARVTEARPDTPKTRGQAGASVPTFIPALPMTVLAIDPRFISGGCIGAVRVVRREVGQIAGAPPVSKLDDV